MYSENITNVTYCTYKLLLYARNFILNLSLIIHAKWRQSEIRHNRININ